MTEQEEMQVFELITAAGGAKSTFMEALYKAKEASTTKLKSCSRRRTGISSRGTMPTPP